MYVLVVLVRPVLGEAHDFHFHSLPLISTSTSTVSTVQVGTSCTTSTTFVSLHPLLMLYERQPPAVEVRRLLKKALH